MMDSVFSPGVVTLPLTFMASTPVDCVIHPDMWQPNSSSSQIMDSNQLVSNTVPTDTFLVISIKPLLHVWLWLKIDHCPLVCQFVCLFVCSQCKGPIFNHNQMRTRVLTSNNTRTKWKQSLWKRRFDECIIEVYVCPHFEIMGNFGTYHFYSRGKALSVIFHEAVAAECTHRLREILWRLAYSWEKGGDWGARNRTRQLETLFALGRKWNFFSRKFCHRN